MKLKFSDYLVRKNGKFKLVKDVRGEDICISDYYKDDYRDINQLYIINKYKLAPRYKLKVTVGTQSYILTERQIHLDNTVNLRDFGGYESSLGGYVREGVLYRSDDLSQLSSQDISYLVDKMKVKDVIDYRSDVEKIKEPNVDLQGVNYHQLSPKVTMAEKAASLDEQKAIYLPFIEMLEDDKHHKSVLSFEKEMLDLYYKLPSVDSSLDAYYRVLKVFIEAKSAVLHHCKVGKDRTGFGTALILLALGVSEEDIMYDYLLSNETRKERLEEDLSFYREHTDNEDLIKGIESMLTVKESYLQKSFDIINKKGGIEEFLFNDIKITKEELDILRSKYLI